jgi:hypothetical protein
MKLASKRKNEQANMTIKDRHNKKKKKFYANKNTNEGLGNG